MAGVLDTVNQRTQLVGQNRLELLLFRLLGDQLYGINVFKVKEVLQCPHLTSLPGRHRTVRGVAHVRGTTLPVIDMSHATGLAPLGDLSGCFVIITEYNRSTQGFLVRSVERIINVNWGAMFPPPRGAGRQSYLTAVTEVDQKLVEILDVEKILAEVAPISDSPSVATDPAVLAATSGAKILVVDDSAIARKQVRKVVEALSAEPVIMKNGREALDYLLAELEAGRDPAREFSLVISDIEMPMMDGYTLTTELRSHPQLKNMLIVLHTSLSGVFNQAMVEKVGADEFIPKFNPDLLRDIIEGLMKKQVSHR